MKFRTLTWHERTELKETRLSSWHKWFALRPVRLTSDRHEVRWLEYVYRKGKKGRWEGGVYWSWTFAESELDILKIDNEK